MCLHVPCFFGELHVTCFFWGELHVICFLLGATLAQVSFASPLSSPLFGPVWLACKRPFFVCATCVGRCSGLE